MTDEINLGPPSQPDEMSIARLRQIVDIYGASSRRWPEAERAAARALAVRSEEARSIVEAGEPVDDLLESLRPPPPSDILAARVKSFASRPAPAPREPRRRAPGLLRSLLTPLAVGGAGAALVAVSLWLVFAGAVGQDPAPTPSIPEIAAQEPGPALLQDVAVVDVGSEASSSERISDADLGLDSVATPPGDGLTQLSSGGLAGIALD